MSLDKEKFDKANPELKRTMIKRACLKFDLKRAKADRERHRKKAWEYRNKIQWLEEELRKLNK